MHVCHHYINTNVVGSLVGQREIKFRGKRVDNGEWAYGCLINWHPNKNPRIIWFEEFDYKETNNEVLPETIGQYTGLKDCHGEEIYEGDILELKYPLSSRDEEDFDDYKLIIVAIVFQSGGFWFTGEGFTDCNWHFYNSEDRKIISKVFENPELLQTL